jgi:Ca-activated chloride channel family protein
MFQRVFVKTTSIQQVKIVFLLWHGACLSDSSRHPKTKGGTIMKEKDTQSTFIISLISAALFFLILTIFGQSQAAGLLKPKTGDDSLISIKSHNVSVVINNGFARTEVDQVFINSGENDLEAIYSFPLPKKASLSELSLWINGQEVVGEVLEKAKAKEIYEDQKAKGNQTAIAEKDEFKTFDISVNPVKAKDQTRVRLVYYQPLTIDLNVGRYVYPLQEGGVDEERISFWSVDSEVTESFTFDLILKSTQPIKDVRIPAHPQAILEKVSPGDPGEGGNEYIYHAVLDYSEGGNLTDDIVFYYRLDDSVPARIELVPYKEAGGSTGTFMLTITPGASLAPISEGVDWTFVLDKSGSMNGGKIQTLVDGVSRVIGKMSPSDRFRVVAFNDSAQDMTNGFKNATAENVTQAINMVKNIQADRGTALHAGLELGLRSVDSERTSAIILVTDGVANVGPAHEDDFLKLVENRDVRLFTFVMGNSANQPLLENLAKASGGFAMDISHSDDVYGKVLQAKNKVLHEAMHDVGVKFSGGGISDLTPASHGSLYLGQQLVLFGKFNKPGPVTISMHAKISGTEHEWSCDTVLPAEDGDNPEIERLWALSTIDEIMDTVSRAGESEKLRKEIVDLGTRYSLVTDYTSMIVLGEQEMENLGVQRNNSNRVTKERLAQQQRQQSPVKSYRVDNSPDGGAFKGAKSPGVGSGPVGPWFLAALIGCGWLVRRRRR